MESPLHRRDAAPILRLRCERTGLCDPAEADAQVRHVAASLAAHPVPFPNSALLTEGAFSAMSIFAIQDAFADYLTAIDQASAGDYGLLLALTEAATAVPPPNPIGSSPALQIPVPCNEYSAPFDLGDKLSKRQADFDRFLAELPAGVFGWFSKQGWVDSAWSASTSVWSTPSRTSRSICGRPTTAPSPTCPCSC